MSEGLLEMAAPHGSRRSMQRPNTQIPTQQPSVKISRLVRISSYIGLGPASRAASPTTSTLPEVVMQRSDSMKSRTLSYGEATHDRSTGLWRDDSNIGNAFDNFRESDRTWHSPNVVQMMETVSCAIMVNGISEPIPRHLNASIISMVEEFRIQLGKLKKLQAEITELQDARQADAKEHMQMTREWEQREMSFRADIERLENIVSLTQDDTQFVTTAPRESLVTGDRGEDVPTRGGRLSSNPGRTWDHVQDVTATGIDDGCSSIHFPDTTIGRTSRLIADHDRDVRLTELLIQNGVGQATKEDKRDADLRERMLAARRFYDTIDRPCSPRHTGSDPLARISNASNSFSSSEFSRSTSSGSSDAQKAVTVTTDKDRVTPQTAPSTEDRAKPPNTNSALATIQEMLRANGGLPEDVVDDSVSDESVSPHVTRRFSSVADDQKSVSAVQLVTSAPNVVIERSRQLPQEYIQSSSETSSTSKVDFLARRDDETTRIPNAQRHHLDRSLRHEGLPSCASSIQNGRSPSALVSPARNHAIGRRTDDGNTASDGSPLVIKASRRQGSSRRHGATSSTCGTRPCGKTQSADDVALGQGTIEAARRQRTIANYHTKASSLVRPEDFRALPPEPKPFMPGLWRPIHTTGPPPGLPVHPLLRLAGQTQDRSAGLVCPARGPDHAVDHGHVLAVGAAVICPTSQNHD